MALVRLKTEDEIPARVDISTIERLPWVDFNTILDNTKYKKRFWTFYKTSCHHLKMIFITFIIILKQIHIALR